MFSDQTQIIVAVVVIVAIMVVACWVIDRYKDDEW